jgi:hypothetical protein
MLTEGPQTAKARRRRRNAGHFRPGPDPRRHTIPPDRAAASRGWRTTIARYPTLGLWLFIRVKQTCPAEQGGRS